MNFANKKVAVIGWGVDTEDVVPWLLEHGAQITAYDRKAEIKSEWGKKLTWQLGSDDFGDLSKFDAIVRNPAVYRYRKEIAEAEKAGVFITSKMKIFFDECPARIIGVTGTKGKGTTATMIYEMLRAGKKDVFIGGNMGGKVFTFLNKLKNDSWVVLELSSFQLVDLHKSPQLAVVLMTTVDHQDWHNSIEEYVRAKMNITKYQESRDVAVINKDYDNSVRIGEEGKAKKIWISAKEMGWVTPDMVRLRGIHNLENVIAAVNVATEAGVERQVIEKVLRSFRGLEHRLEEVKTVAGVSYFDDSISTVPETAMAAIGAFVEPKILIMGGSEKGSDFTSLGKLIVQNKTVRAVVLIGQMAKRIEEAMIKAGAETLIVHGRGKMSEIVEQARGVARSGDVVVLSPAAASFDMFENYKDRGDQFKKAVKRLK